MPIRHWPVEKTTEDDPVSGLPVTRWTNYKGHSHHLYFTNPGWWDQGRRMLFGSDREGRSNLFSLELQTGAITQLTDADMPGPPSETSFLYTAVNPVRPEAYFWRGRQLLAIDLHAGEERLLWTAPEDYDVNMLNVTADGASVCTAIYESRGGDTALLRGYIGFREYFEARPNSRVLKIDTETGRADVVHEERAWIGHVNTSPTRSHLLTFCHEGPWRQVGQRIWGLDLNSGQVWKIRPQEPEEAIGHEYWMADGERIGYHGHIAGRSVFGSVRYDNENRVEADFPFGSQHFFSLDPSLIIGDGFGRSGEDYVLVWTFDGQVFEGPRVLCRHRGSAHIQATHIHPRISADGRYVVFTSDARGYGDLYTVPMEAFDRLPHRPTNS